MANPASALNFRAFSSIRVEMSPAVTFHPCRAKKDLARV